MGGSIVDYIFKGITHSRARSDLIREFEKRKRVHCQSIEHLNHRNVPDLNVGVNGIDWWIEIKVKNDVLSVGQRLWLSGRILAGGKCAVVHWKSKYIMVLDLTHKSDNHLFRQTMSSLKEVVNYFFMRSEELKCLQQD